MSSFFCLTQRLHDDDEPTVEYHRSSIYDSVFTYNTERQFRNNYSPFAQESQEEATDEAPTVNKVAELFFMVLSATFVVFTLPFSLFLSIKFISSFERLVVMRLGRAQKVHGPGAVFVFPFIDKTIRIDIRVLSCELPPFQVVTSDRGLAEVTVVVFSKVVDPLVAYCGIQNRDQTLRSLAYNTVYNNLVKKMLCDLTNPESLAQILAKSQDEFNAYCKSLGIELTQISVIQLKIIKQGENQTLSLFNTILKSDFGAQLMNHFGPQLQSFLTQASVSANSSPPTTATTSEQLLINFDNVPLLPRDTDLERLVRRIRSCCDGQLVAKVGKYYRIRCPNNDGHSTDFDLNLRDGEGSCEWFDLTSNFPTPDVVFTLQKETLIALINETISPLSAYLNGSVAITGSVTDVFPLKHLSERAKRVE